MMQLGSVPTWNLPKCSLKKKKSSIAFNKQAIIVMFAVSPLLGDPCRLLLSVAFVLACGAEANRPGTVSTEISCKSWECVQLRRITCLHIKYPLFTVINKAFLFSNCLYSVNRTMPVVLIENDSMRYALHI